MGCRPLREEKIMERYSNRENVIALYLKEHLGGAEVKTLMDDIPSALNEYLPHSDQSVLHVARCHRGISCVAQYPSWGGCRIQT